MSDRPADVRLTIPGEAIEEIVELAATRVLERIHDENRDGHVEFLTTTEYAKVHRTTAGAVLARIHRGTLKAIRPPGAREWLIPVEQTTMSGNSPRDAGTSGGATPKE